MADNLYWVWLSQACRYNSDTFDRLIRHFSSARAVFTADEDEILSVIGKRNADFNRLCKRDLTEAGHIMDHCMMTDIGVIAYNDEDYPASLRLLTDPPPVLYYRGKRPVWRDRLHIGVVGTRKMSEYGKRMAFEIAHDLSRAGAVVVTGMALGIDGVASAAACAGGTDTLAVLGSGVDVVYPPEHMRLYREIVKHGTVLSEFAPGTPPEGRNFPRRNRIISGLSQGVLVIEGDHKSGALITAKHAEEQARDVFALPGNADEENSESTAFLLKRGARPVTCADDIIRVYDAVYPASLNMLKLLEKPSVKRERVLSSFGVSARATYPRYRRYRDTEDAAENSRPPLPEAEEAPQTKKAKEQKRAEKALREDAAQTDVIIQPNEKIEALLDKDTLAVYKCIPQGRAVTADEICKAGLPAAQVMTALTMLEIHKCVTALAGGRYIRH